MNNDQSAPQPPGDVPEVPVNHARWERPLRIEVLPSNRSLSKSRFGSVAVFPR